MATMFSRVVVQRTSPYEVVLEKQLEFPLVCGGTTRIIPA
jgi:hypothetical protein